MRASIRRVAEVAGVSPMTVSNVMNKRVGQMTEETQSRVLQVIRDLDYVPVRTATQNRRVKNNAIGVVFLHQHSPDGENGFPTFTGMCRRAREIDHDLTVFLRSEPNWVRAGSEQQFLDRRCDGFIFVGGNRIEISEALVRHGIPVVECFSVAPARGVACILGDNADAMRQAVGHMVQAGHTRIAHLAGPRQHLEAQERLAGFRAAMLDAFGADYPDLVVQGETWGDLWGMRDGRDETGVLTIPLADAVLDMGATAVVCANDRLALALWRRAEERGLRVPDDLSITGMDDMTQAERRGLTSVATPFEKIGEAAVEAIQQLQSSVDSVMVSRVLPVKLIARDSVGPPSLSRGATSMIKLDKPDQLKHH